MTLRVNNLNENIKQKDEEISELKKENNTLKSTLEKSKNKFYFLKHFIMMKILNNKEKEKYIQLTHDLHDHRALDDEDFKELMEFSIPINNSRDYITKEKDDYER